MSISRTDEAIRRIVELISVGHYTAGSRLPPESQLAATLGLSRNSMREAVKALEQAKILDVRRGDGTYVTSLRPQLLLHGMKLAIGLLDPRYLVELAEVRRLLEPAATGLAATRISDEELAGVRASLDAMRACEDDVEELIRHDYEFHRGIVRGTGNDLLESLLDGLHAPTLRGRVWRARTEVDSTAASIREHEALYAALAARDPGLAEAIALAHVASTQAWVRQLVEQGVDDAITDREPEPVPQVVPGGEERAC